jgi:hypothetical protein
MIKREGGWGGEAGGELGTEDDRGWRRHGRRFSGGAAWRIGLRRRGAVLRRDGSQRMEMGKGGRDRKKRGGSRFSSAMTRDACRALTHEVGAP